MYIHVGMLLFGDTILQLYVLRFGLILSLFLPVLKSIIQVVYHLLSRKAKISLRHFFVDLIQCFWLIGCVIQIFLSPGTVINVY